MARTPITAATPKVVRAGDVEIATDSFGDPAHPPMLLIMGAMASMLWWPDGFCRLLAESGRHVIRYDNRDTGLSTTWEPGKPDYSFDDMVDDAVRVMDAYGLAAANVAGMSMGGMIAQLLALRYPARVLSLTVISTSPVGVDTAHLPGATAAYSAHAAQEVDWSNREDAIRFVVEDMRMLAGPSLPFDGAAARRFVERDHDRARSFASAANHFVLKEGAPRDDRIADLQAPLLVIHGTADPLFPIEHGEAFLQAVPGARLLRLEGGGHELNELHWPEVVVAIVGHTAEKT